MSSKIEWLKDPITGKPGYTINPVKGLCPMACPYCYARRMYKRFGWNPEIRFEAMAFNPLIGLTTPSKVFIGSTMELFGDWVKADEMSKIFSLVRYYNTHTFIFLTKCPGNLHLWSPFPDNCWVGVSWVGDDETKPLRYLADVHAKIKFISLLLIKCFQYRSSHIGIRCGIQLISKPRNNRKRNQSSSWSFKNSSFKFG